MLQVLMFLLLLRLVTQNPHSSSHKDDVAIITWCALEQI